MLDKLIDFIINFINEFLPAIVYRYEKAIHYRNGIPLRVLEEGLWFKIPFLDNISKTVSVTQTLSIPTQSLTTNDGLQCVIKSVVKFNINDVTLLMNVYDSTDALSDTLQGIINNQVSTRKWAECTDDDIVNIVTKKLRASVKKWGIDVEEVTFTDRGLIRSIRLFNETSNIVNG